MDRLYVKISVSKMTAKRFILNINIDDKENYSSYVYVITSLYHW